MTSYIYDMVDTWNAGATTFTAVKMNVTDTASNAASLLMDLQVGGISKFSVDKTGKVNNIAAAGLNANNEIRYAANTIGAYVNGTYSVNIQAGAFRLVSGMRLGFTDGAADPQNSVLDAFLTRRGTANLRLGAADAAAPVAQTLSVQSVVAGTTNTAGANLTITGSQGTGTGAGGSIVFQVAPAGSSGTAQNALATAWSISGAGHFLAGADNTYDIGATSSGRPRNVFVAGNTVTGGSLTVGSSGGRSIIGGGKIEINSGSTTMTNQSDGVFMLSNYLASDFGRLQFGGTTSSFPAIKRSSTTLQARLADDSAFAPVQGKLTTDTAYAAGDPTTTGYLVVYDSTGTAYKIPAVAV